MAADPERRPARRGARSGPSDRAHPPGKRAQGAVRQRRFHHPHRRPAGRRERPTARRAVCAQRAPEHIYRHRWQAHDLVFWDNRSLIHLAGGCPAHLRRKLYRTTIQGDAPF
ncbi:TauD/TfdA family dioxygenase [Pseudomonas aeruginosa]|uniref:TauD/TfdA family dioxygenase n=1 Tax=Pseudomonas aeruginosa TaxID=287 RepID=UPI0037A6E8DA